MVWWAENLACFHCHPVGIGPGVSCGKDFLNWASHTESQSTSVNFLTQMCVKKRETNNSTCSPLSFYWVNNIFRHSCNPPETSKISDIGGFWVVQDAEVRMGWRANVCHLCCCWCPSTMNNQINTVIQPSHQQKDQCLKTIVTFLVLSPIAKVLRLIMKVQVRNFRSKEKVVFYAKR